MTSIPVRFMAAVNERVLPEDTPEDFTFKYIDISQVDGSGVVSIPKDTLTFGSAPSRARRLAGPGTTVVSTVRTYLRAIGTVPIHPEPLVFSTGFAVLRPLWGDPRFFAYACRSDAFVNEVVARSVGVSYPAISSSDLMDIKLPAPDVGEQRRIADFLDDRVARIDQIIGARAQQREALGPLRHAAVFAALANEPKAPLRRLLNRVITGGTPSHEADDPSGLPWYSPGAFNSDLTLGAPTRHVSLQTSVCFRPQSVLLVGIGATAGKVAWLDHPGSGNQQLTCLEQDPHRSDGRFLLHQLDSMREGLLRQAPASTLPILNNEFVRSHEVAVPSLDRQRVLGAEWDAHLDEDATIVRCVNRSISLLKEYKQSLITAAVTGELDVTTAGSGIPG